MATKSKKCTGACGKTKAIAMFTKKASQSDSLNPWCKECAAAYRASKLSGSTSKKSKALPAKKGGSARKTSKTGSTKKMTKKPSKKTANAKPKAKASMSSKKTARKTK